jgi:hypothetical protein
MKTWNDDTLTADNKEMGYYKAKMATNKRIKA